MSLEICVLCRAPGATDLHEGFVVCSDGEACCDRRMTALVTSHVEECDVVSFGWTLEDPETEPVPSGCHGCWKDGPRCTRCEGLTLVGSDEGEDDELQRAA